MEDTENMQASELMVLPPGCVGPFPAAGKDAVLPPMTGWWGVVLMNSDFQPCRDLRLWWDGFGWVDREARTLSNVGWWYGLVSPAPEGEYTYHFHSISMPMPARWRRVPVLLPRVPMGDITTRIRLSTPKADTCE